MMNLKKSFLEHCEDKQFEINLSDAYKYTSKVMAENTLKNDAKEGIDSFLEKRDPNWEPFPYHF